MLVSDLEQVRAIYRMANDGAPMDLLVDTYDMSVYQILKAYRDGGVIHRYENGDDLADIAEEFDISVKYIGSIRRKYGVESNRRDTSSLDESKIVDYYKRGRSGPWIAKKYEVSHDRIYRILHKHGVKTDPGRYGYDIDDSFFEEVNSESSAYWLGFLFADGYINPNSNLVDLKLKLTDRPHLEKFRKDLKYGGPISDVEVPLNGNLYYQSRLSFSSHKMQTDLITKGCRPNKSFNLNPPIGVPDELIRHFVRGLWDGDGYIGYNGRFPRMNLVGTHEVLSWVIEVSPMENSRVVESKSIWCIYVSRKDIKKLTGWLYEGASVYLDRKYDVAMEILKEEE